MNRRRRSVYLDDEHWDGLTALAVAEDRSVNGIVRRAVAAYLADHEPETDWPDQASARPPTYAANPRRPPAVVRRVVP